MPCKGDSMGLANGGCLGRHVVGSQGYFPLADAAGLTVKVSGDFASAPGVESS